jgi:GT2 family glycosyltransferase
MTVTVPSASIIVCAFDEGRWTSLCRAIDSLGGQTRAGDELMVVIDHNPRLLTRARRELTSARVLPNHHARGLSGARNTGVEAASGDVLVFMDDDAVAEPGWLQSLLAPYDHPEVIAVGGAVVPDWARGRPRGFPEEFDWVVGCTYRGLPRHRRPVRNVIGANMSFRRDVFESVGGFTDGIGRVGRRPMGCEETELCIRAGLAFPDGVIIYEPAARVSHQVPHQRASWRYFAARCFSEGLSKAVVAQVAGSTRGLSSERSYASRTVPLGVARGLGCGLSGDPWGLLRAAALLAGLCVTALGFIAGSAKRAAGATEAQRDRTPRPAREEWLYLNVHGRIGVRLKADAPGTPQLLDMFAPFRAESISRCELTVDDRMTALEGMVTADDQHRYRSDAFELPGRLQVVADGDGFRLAGCGELLAPVLALVDALMASRGAAMVHGATVARDGRGVCLAAAGGAGKTSATIGLVRDHGYAFMGDDWTFISDEGEILGYAKPLFVRPHHRALFPQLFADKRKPLAPARFAHLLGRTATAVHPLISRYPTLARVVRGLSPEHLIVPAQMALPGVQVASTAAAAAAVFVERGAGDEWVLQPRDPAWMASRLVGDFVAELPRAARELQIQLGACGLLAFDALIAEKGRILRGALAGRPCFLLRVPEHVQAAEAATAIAQRIDRVLSASADTGG